MRGELGAATTEAMLSGVSAASELGEKLVLLKLIVAGHDMALGRRVCLDFSPSPLGPPFVDPSVVCEEWFEHERSGLQLPEQIEGRVGGLSFKEVADESMPHVEIESDNGDRYELPLKLFIFGL